MISSECVANESLRIVVHEKIKHPLKINPNETFVAKIDVIASFILGRTRYQLLHLRYFLPKSKLFIDVFYKLFHLEYNNIENNYFFINYFCMERETFHH